MTPAISEIFQSMVDYSNGNVHDIAHFTKVWAYSRMLGQMNGLDGMELYRLEVIAITHDIACPICREKYGSAWGKKQEIEGPPLLKNFLEKFDLPDEFIDRVAYVNEHHHTYKNIQGLDWQILVEADFLVNAEEGGLTEKGVTGFRNRVFKTEAGKKLLDSIFQKRINKRS